VPRRLGNGAAKADLDPAIKPNPIVRGTRSFQIARLYKSPGALLGSPKLC